MIPPSDLQTRSLTTRIRICVGIFIAGLVISGATAIPLESEINLLASWADHDSSDSLKMIQETKEWILKVDEGITKTDENYPFLFYGTDWLAFGHFVIAIAFIGALKDPVRNIWLFQFGMISCVLVIPFAMVFGHIRGIPIEWRLTDCLFGVVGFFPVWLGYRWTKKLSLLQQSRRKENG